MATSFAKASYTEVYDLKTTASKPTIIGIHTPISGRPQLLMAGFFTQFKKFKYTGCSVTMIPAATLPLDIAGVGYAAGDTFSQASPRDVLNPILHKGYIGESLGYYLDNAFGPYLTGNTKAQFSSLERSEPPSASYVNWYYNQLLDKSWRKSDVRVGFKRGGLHPRMWALGIDHPIQPNLLSEAGSIPGITNVQQDVTRPAMTVGRFGGSDADQAGWNEVLVGKSITDVNGLDPGGVTEVPVETGINFQTYKSVPIGWQDTLVNTKPGQIIANGIAETKPYDSSVQYSTIGKHFMYLICLPPSDTTVVYWRMIVRHSFAFRGYRSAGISMGSNTYPVSAYGSGQTVSNPIGYNMLYTVPTASSSSKSPEHEIEFQESGTVDVSGGDVELLTDSAQ